ncbi:MAG: D-methionine transport system permease protein MetI [Chlamydiae bacterium]|nr:D-methionine transport system permease protein MetI [Chlamydiota bacterium]
MSLLLSALVDTFYMVFTSAFFAALIGLPIGIILFITAKGQTLTYRILGTIVNIGRSFPFAILLIALIPFTRFIVGTSLGTTASIVPLSVAAAPFFARLVESSLQGISPSLIEAATVMGSTPMQIIRKVLIPEALPSLINNFTVTLINLVGYSAMAGLVGGGGLGAVAIQYGYLRFNAAIMFWTVFLLILLVQLIQWLGNKWTQSLLKKRGLL